jgi:hypothetical protein
VAREATPPRDPLHPLTQAQLAARNVEEVLEIEQFGEEAQGLSIALLGDPVHRGKGLQGIRERQIPPELGALPVDDADIVGIRRPLPVRDQAIHLDRSGSRRQHAGQQLDRGRLARTVGAKVAHDLAFADREADVIDGFDGPVLRLDEVAQFAAEASPGLSDPEMSG